ncbi:MAG: hypothetical protein VKN56_03705 [Cyanobacteriota bacterium]|nr:hypothetical protein [Cyanobacteriota bacterium]
MNKQSLPLILATRIFSLSMAISSKTLSQLLVAAALAFPLGIVQQPARAELIEPIGVDAPVALDLDREIPLPVDSTTEYTEYEGIIAPPPIAVESEPPGEDFIFWSSSGSSAETMVYTMLEPRSITATPGPLPVAAALAGWSCARRLRRRCKTSNRQGADPT